MTQIPVAMTFRLILIKNALRWYGTPANINVDKSRLQSKYFYSLKKIKYYNI